MLYNRRASYVKTLVTMLASVFLLFLFGFARPQTVAFASDDPVFSVVLPSSVEFTYDGHEENIVPSVVGFSENAEYFWEKNGAPLSVYTKFLAVKNVSDSGKYTLTVKENGITATSDTTVKILPKLIKAEIRTFVCFYGDDPIEPEYKLLTVPADGDDEASIGFYAELPESPDVGTYKVRGFCRNPNYHTDAESTVTILKRGVTVRMNFPSVALLTRGEKLKFTFSADGLLPSSDARITVKYHKLNDRGVPGEGREEISQPGKYILTAFFAEEQKNYELSLSRFSSEITVYPRENEQNGIEVFLENGFTDDVGLTVTSLDAESYASQFEKPLDLQFVCDAFAVELSNPNDVKMEIRVPVTDKTSCYTVAVRDAKGHLTYTPCKAEDGYVSFVVGTKNTVFILWKDKDFTPYAIVCALLAFLLVILISIFVNTYKKYKSLKISAYSFLPLIGANSALRFSIYYFVFTAIALGIACFALAVAIIVVNRKIQILRKNGI